MDGGFKLLRLMEQLTLVGGHLERVLRAAVETRRRSERMLVRARKAPRARREVSPSSRERDLRPKPA
jgi:hypothetical protein